MICVIALVVFGILGIFSLSYRRLAYEAFDCVFRRVTLRKCESNLDQRVKGKIIGRLMRLNETFAGFVYKYFEVFSWTLVILMFVSAYYSGLGVYNFYVYGNCYGPVDDPGFCPLDVLKGDEYSTCGDVSGVEIPTELIVPEILETDNYVGPSDAKVTVIQFGCYTCEYTRLSQEVFNRVVNEYKDRVKFVYLDFPIEKHEGAHIAAHSAECAKVQNVDAFWPMHDLLFSNSDFSLDAIKGYAESLNLNVDEFETCVSNPETHAKDENDFQRGLQSGVVGTPTFFINEKSYVGNIKYATLKYMIDEELKK